MNDASVLRANAGLRRYFANTSWLVMERVLRLSVGLFVGVYVARYLGPVQFGQLAFAQSLVLLATPIAVLGLESLLVRELVRNPQESGRIIGTVAALRGLAGLCSGLFLGAAVAVMDITQTERLLVAILAATLLLQAFNVVDLYFQARVHAKAAVRAQVAQLAVSAVLRVALVQFGAPLTAFAAVIVVDALVLAGGLWLQYGRVHAHPDEQRTWSLDLALARRLVAQAWPLLLSGISVALYTRIDLIMVRSLLDSSATGHYAAAVRLVESWYLIPAAICASVFPAVINARTGNPLQYRLRMRQLYALMIWASVGFALICSLLAPWIMVTLYGPAFAQSASVFAILAWAGVFVSLGVASHYWLIAEGMQRHALFRTLLGGVINVILNPVLVLEMGIVGAAWATFIAYVSAGYLYGLLFPSTRIMCIDQMRAALVLIK